MWENLLNRKPFKQVKVTYKIEGLNQDRLISALKKRDFVLYDIKKPNNRQMYITVNLNQSKNFFAIIKNMCYNIKKVRFSGKALPVYKLAKNLGLLLGAFAFVVIAYLSGDLIFDISYSGSGSIYQREIEQYLSSRGVGKFCAFSSFSLSELEDDVLASSEHLTFVSLEKKGNTLSVYSSLKTDKVQTLAGDKTELIAIESGVLESLKVYRGTALYNVGDRVERGANLVGAFVQIKDENIPSSVLAYATIISEKQFTYLLDGDNAMDKAELFAIEELSNREVLKAIPELVGERGQGKYEYLVKVEYRTVLYAG